MRRATKRDALTTLKSRGLQVDAVIDVGVFEDTFELREAFPEAFHLLFEPLAHLNATIERNYASVRHKLVTAACSDTLGEGYLKIWRHEGGGGAITHSQLQFTKPADGSTDEVQAIPILRVDDAVKAEGLNGRLLFKIDVDGHEMRVLRGAEGILDQVDVVIIETLPHDMQERLGFLQSRGFKVADIVDIVHYDDMFWQMDTVLISPRLSEDPRFQPYRGREPNLGLFRQLD